VTDHGPLIVDVECASHALRWLACRHATEFPVLLDSAAQGPLGRYSVLAAFPTGTLTLDHHGQLVSRGLAPAMAARSSNSNAGAAFLAALDEGWRTAAPAATSEAGQPPFTGGWMVYLGYEMAGGIEPRLELPAATHSPVACAWRVPAALVFDHAAQRCQAVVERAHPSLLPRLLARLQEARRAGLPGPEAFRVVATLEEEPELYLERVRRAQQFIRAGDIYQANLSRGWQVRLAPGVDAGAVYESLRRHNPAPFAALARLGTTSLLCSSPERLVSVRGDRIATRPIAGTRPRSGQPQRESGELSELIGHPKERAEHVMLIDLERNDLGKLCQPGTVQVDEFMALESYAHVHHIVSNVSGRLRSGVSPATVLRAVFPGGTITGVPKFRCMQLIGELEGAPRGAYTGALGYLGHDGSMDFNILIRSLTLDGAEVRFRAGAGIVADSDPGRELEETRAKARGLLRALGVTT